MPPSPGELMARLKVGQRAIDTQHELAARTRALEAALVRLEAVSALAAGVKLVAATSDEPVSTVVQRKLESLLPALDVTPGAAVARAYGGVVLPASGQWLDVVVEVHGSLRLGRPAPSPGAALELPGRGSSAPASCASTAEQLTDLVTTLLKRTAGALVGAGRLALVPAPGRPVPPTTVLAGAPVQVGPLRLWVATHRLEARPRAFEALTPGLVLLAPLKPRSKTGLEVLRAGTWLTTSHLERTRPFFAGDDASSEALVGEPSPLARAIGS
jgi:hypothetical protein